MTKHNHAITLPFAVSVESITPEMAHHYLMTRDPKNRKLSALLTRRYAEMMRRGAWGLTHQGIAFDHEHHLFDGQHRLSAICMVKQPITMVVYRYMIDTGAKLDIDCGKGRTLADRRAMVSDQPESATLIGTVKNYVILAERVTQKSTVEFDQISAALENELVQWASTLRVPNFVHARAAMAFLHPVAPQKIESIEHDLLSDSPSPMGRRLLLELASGAYWAKAGGTSPWRLGMRWCHVLLSFIDGKTWSDGKVTDDEVAEVLKRRSVVGP